MRDIVIGGGFGGTVVKDVRVEFKVLNLNFSFLDFLVNSY